MMTTGRRASVPSLDGVGFARLVSVGRYGHEPILSAVSLGNAAGHPLALVDELGSGTASTAAYEAGVPVLSCEVLGGSVSTTAGGRHYAVVAAADAEAGVPSDAAARGVCSDPEDIG